jgi:hypothetical protein
MGNDKGVAEVPHDWDFTGELTWDELIDGEMKTIKYYMEENKLPWRFLRIAFEMELAAYGQSKLNSFSFSFISNLLLSS